MDAGTEVGLLLHYYLPGTEVRLLALLALNWLPSHLPALPSGFQWSHLTLALPLKAGSCPSTCLASVARVLLQQDGALIINQDGLPPHPKGAPGQALLLPCSQGADTSPQFIMTSGCSA